MCILYKKDTFVHYLSNGTLGTTVALLEAELQQLPNRAIFGGFQDLFDTLNHLVSVTNEGIKRQFWVSTTLGSTYSWGSVGLLSQVPGKRKYFAKISKLLKLSRQKANSTT